MTPIDGTVSTLRPANAVTTMTDGYDIDAIRRVVVAQADAAGPGGWMDMPVPAGVHPSGALRVPRGAFERWAAWRAGGGHLTAPWEPVSPQGVKMKGDDAYHTDWMLGAGLGPQDMRASGGNPNRDALCDAAEAARSAVARRLLGHAAAVLLAGPRVEGVAWHPASPDAPLPDLGAPPVAVLRDARPDWLALVASCIDAGGAAVVERGGEMAHLVAELRGSDRGPMLRVAGARRLFPDGTPLSVSPADGEVALRDDGRTPEAFPGQGDFTLPEPEPEPEAQPMQVHDLAAKGALAVEGTDVVLVPVTREIADRIDGLDYLVGSRRSVGVGSESYGVLHASSPEGRCASQHLVVTIHPKPHVGRPGEKLPRYSAGQRDWLGSPDLLRAAVDAPLAVLEADLRREAEAAYEARAAALHAARRAEEERLLSLPEADFLAEVEAQAAEEEGFYAMETTWSGEELHGIVSDNDAAWRKLEDAAFLRGTAMPPRRRPRDLSSVEEMHEASAGMGPPSWS